jgi:alpha-1,6-mannosyltransferase
VDRASLSSRIALGLSVVSVGLVATVAATPSSPFQPILSSGARPFGPFRGLSAVVGLDRLSSAGLATVGVAAVLLAAAAFVLVLRAAWRGEVSLRVVLGLAVAYHAVVLLLPLLFSRDVYSYAYIGRIAGTYHANPYVLTPADYPRDPLAAFVGPKWVSTPAVYGPLFTQIASLITRAVGSISGWISAFQVLAAAASLGTIALVTWLSGRLMPGRRAFAVAAFGLNPVVVFQSVGSGHNDLLVALGVAGALALVVLRRELLATVVLALATLVKVVAAIPLALLVVAVVARRPRDQRVRALIGHAGAALATGLLFAAPFLQTKDPTLGVAELATHEGWLAPSRLFRRALDAVSGDTLGVVSRLAFGLVLVVALVAIARWLVRRGSALDPAAEGASWGWGLLCLMLLGPVLLPWYVTWALPLVWLLPSVPRSVLLGTSVALGVSQFSAEPARYPGAFDANLFVGHYVLTPIVVLLLGWLLLDLWRRFRAGTPLEDEPREVPAARRDH